MSQAKALLPSSRRRYPRAELRVKARLFVGGDKKRQFEAVLSTSNVSVGGLFVESTFTLKLGLPLEVELRLPPDDRLVRVRGRVVRVEQGAKAPGGFAIKFEEYYEDSEVALAHHFLSPVLKEFLAGYVKARRLQPSAEYLAHAADMLAAWELTKSKLDDGASWRHPALMPSATGKRR